MSNSTPLAPVPVPIVVGVTGHCDIAESAIGAIRASVEALLRRLKEHEFKNALHVMSALAPGADQLVAQAAVDASIPLIAVLPMKYNCYLDTMTHTKDREQFMKLWEAANLQLELPDRLDFDPNECPRENETKQYEQLGLFLAKRSHILLALWDGNQPNVPNGGTADVLNMRFDGIRSVELHERSSLFVGSGSYLDTPPAEPVLQIVTPRSSEPGSSLGVAAGVCRLIYDANAHSYDELADFSQFIEVVQRKTAPVVKAFNQIAELNTMLLGLTDTDQTTLKLQYSYLRIQPMMDVHGSQLHKLGMLQAGMDTLSIRYQRRVFGTFVGGTLSENWTRMVKQWAIGIWPKANVMAFFTIYVPLSAVLFELYTKELPPDGLGRAISKFLFIALMLGVMIVRTKVRQWRWQDMFQDYRAMAEALRVQLYWAISRLPNGVSDSDLRKQSVEMDWIQFALRGPAVWSSAYALGGQEQHRAIVLESWIRDQCAYFMGRNGFPGRAKQYEDLNERNEKFSGFFFWLAIVLTIPTWLLQVGAELDRLHGCFLLLHRYMDHHLYGLLDMAAIVSIAFGASIAVARNIRGYEAHAKGCALMGSIYSRAECLLRDPKISDTGFKILIRELGREALSESADWLRDQRNRSVDFN